VPKNTEPSAEVAELSPQEAEAAVRTAERARCAARLAACRELADEIASLPGGGTDRLAELLAAVVAARDEFAAACRAWNAQLAGWLQQMHDLAVPAHKNPLLPSGEHGHLGHNGSTIIAGPRRLDRVAADHLVQLALTSRGEELDRLLASLRAADDPQAGPVKIWSSCAAGRAL